MVIQGSDIPLKFIHPCTVYLSKNGGVKWALLEDKEVLDGKPVVDEEGHKNRQLQGYLTMTQVRLPIPSRPWNNSSCHHR